MVLTGQIGLRMHGTSFISKAIEWDTYSNTHHVVIAISETHAFSAEPGGAVIRPIDHWPDMVWSNFDLTDEERTAIVAGALARVGAPYNFAIFPILFLHRIFRAKVPECVSDWLSRRPNIDCSQAADDIYRDAGIDLFTSANVLTTPGDFERYFRDRGWLPEDQLRGSAVAA